MCFVWQAARKTDSDLKQTNNHTSRTSSTCLVMASEKTKSLLPRETALISQVHVLLLLAKAKVFQNNGGGARGKCSIRRSNGNRFTRHRQNNGVQRRIEFSSQRMLLFSTSSRIWRESEEGESGVPELFNLIGWRTI